MSRGWLVDLHSAARTAGRLNLDSILYVLLGLCCDLKEATGWASRANVVSGGGRMIPQGVCRTNQRYFYIRIRTL